LKRYIPYEGTRHAQPKGHVHSNSNKESSIFIYKKRKKQNKEIWLLDLNCLLQWLILASSQSKQGTSHSVHSGCSHFQGKPCHSTITARTKLNLQFTSLAHSNKNNFTIQICIVWIIKNWPLDDTIAVASHNQDINTHFLNSLTDYIPRVTILYPRLHLNHITD